MTGTPASLTVTFLGVSTLLVDDGVTSIMTDGFFTRPSLLKTATGRIAPDRAVIAWSLRQLGVTSLAAVICTHAHYDHALDAAVVAERTGADLVGSSSTANIGYGHRLPKHRIRVVTSGESLRFGDFSITLLESEHSPNAQCPGAIDAPLRPPARFSAYRMGECYSVLIEHRGRTLLVHGSAGYRPSALHGYAAEVAYLGIGTLGKQSAEFRDAYWRETVIATGARRVILIHWDDFWRSLGQPLVPMSRLIDDFDGSMEFLLTRGRQDGVEVVLPVAWQPADPWAGL
jgi:L-ascorbate metabolism protein UlaG (beta-lactamase superfamily)